MQRVGAGEREARRDGVAGPALAVPALGQLEPLVVGAVRGGEQVLPQDPVGQHQPRGHPQPDPGRLGEERVHRAGRSASRTPARSWSRPGPARTTKSVATEAAYDASASRASSGSAHFSSQSSSGIPSPPIARTCGIVHVGVDEAGQHQPLAQVDDLVGAVQRARRERLARHDHPVAARRARGRTPPAGGRRRRGCAGCRGRCRGRPSLLLRRVTAVGTPSRSNAASSAAATDTAIAAGPCSSSRPGSPIGVSIRSTTSGRNRRDSSCERNRAHLADDPISPIGPRWSAAQRGVDDREVLGVVVGQHQHAGAGRQLAEHQLGDHRAPGGRARPPPRRPAAPARPRERWDERESTRCRSRSWRARIRASSRPDVADAEDRHGRHDGAAARAARSPLPRSTARRAGTAPCRTGSR